MYIKREVSSVDLPIHFPFTMTGIESKSIENRLRRWDFDLYVSGFWHFHAKTPRGIVDF